MPIDNATQSARPTRLLHTMLRVSDLERSLQFYIEKLGMRLLRQEGYPVDCVRPQGAMYLSLQLDLIGRSVGGVRIG